MIYQNVIDTDNYAASGIEVFQFPGGEWHANVPSWPRLHVHVWAKIRTWDDFGKLLVVLSSLDTQHVAVDLFCPYLPGARQDRNPNGLTPATNVLYAFILQEYTRKITAVDVHSEATEKVYDGGLRNIQSYEFIKDLITVQPDHVVAPDKGAHRRASRVAGTLGVPQVIQCEKERDFETGELKGFTFPEGAVPASDRLLIVDDICDGGGTFVGLLAKIRETHTGPVDLFVTHGIFSKGLAPLDGFDNIYTTDSFWRPDEITRTGDVGIKWPKTIKLLPYYIGGLQA